MDSLELEQHATAIAEYLGLQTTESRPKAESIALTLSAQNVSVTLDRVKKAAKRSLGKVAWQELRSPQGGDQTFELMVFTDRTLHGSSHIFVRYTGHTKELVMTCIRSSDELVVLRNART